MKPSVVFSALCLLASSCCNLPAAEPSPGPDKNGLNVLVIGHSLAGNLHALAYFAAEAGHPAHNQDNYNILGAGIEHHYASANTGWHKNFFEGGRKWDALVMSARNPGSDEEYAPKFADEAFKLNPKCQIYIYGNWPELSDNFEKPVFQRTEAHIEKVGAAVDKAFPDAPKARMMPSSMIIRELGRMADRGELPGVMSHYDLYADGGDHPSRFGAYALNMMVMSMLYNEPPWTYPTDICPKDARGNKLPTDKKYDIQVPEETAAVIKRVVWDILQTYPPAGMPPSLVIANRSLDPVIAGLPYKTELKALNAAGTCAWSLVKGTLPPGLTLSPQGILAGTTSATGNFPVTVKLANGGNTFERPLVVSVSKGGPPSIPDQTLKTARLDEYVMQPLKIDGGVGAISWSLVDGKLPYGVRLSPGGMLVGSPGEAGHFTFKVKAEDSFPGGPRSTEKELTWTTGPAASETLQVKALEVPAKGDDKAFAIDGNTNKPFWKLDQPIAKKVKGEPAAKASFGAVWTYAIQYSKTGARDLVLAIKVLDGPKGKGAKDGVHVFIDGNHNRSVIYSGDDTHFFYARSKPFPPQCIRGKIWWFTKAAVQEIEGGYTMEISLQGAAYFGGEGNWLPFGENSVYGLDLAVDEGGEGSVSQQVWRGDASDAEDTSHFGTVVLSGQPALTAHGN